MATYPIDKIITEYGNDSKGIRFQECGSWNAECGMRKI